MGMGPHDQLCTMSGSMRKYLRLQVFCAFERTSIVNPSLTHSIEKHAKTSSEAAAAVLGDAALAKTQKICVNAGGWQVEGETVRPAKLK